MSEATTVDFHELQKRVWENGKPSFEIHISRPPCEVCIKFVRLLSQTTGLGISIRVGALTKEVEQEGGGPKSLRQKKPRQKNVRKQDEDFGPIPPEWPESLRRIFTESERSGGRGCREETSNAAPPEYEGNPSDAVANAVELEDNDVQVISAFEYYHVRPPPTTPEHQADVLYPSIESVSDSQSLRTVTTPNRSPLPVSPRTDMYIRSRRYNGPTSIAVRERSYIQKPVSSPITRTPSDLRRRYGRSSLAAGGKRKRGGNNSEECDTRSGARKRTRD